MDEVRRPKKRLPKEETRENLVQTTLTLLENDGLEAVKARNVAEGAGVALGTIYNMFEDLDGLIMEANGRTFADLGMAMGEVAKANHVNELGAFDSLMAFCEGYIEFVLANSNRWLATISYSSQMSAKPPAWYVERQDNLFAMVEGQLEREPQIDKTQIEPLARAMWCSVHGIVSTNFRTPMHPEPKPVMMEYCRMVLSALMR